LPILTLPVWYYFEGKSTRDRQRRRGYLNDNHGIVGFFSGESRKERLHIPHTELLKRLKNGRLKHIVVIMKTKTLQHHAEVERDGSASSRRFVNE
jgi:hypothetical protein